MPASFPSAAPRRSPTDLWVPRPGAARVCGPVGFHRLPIERRLRRVVRAEFHRLPIAGGLGGCRLAARGRFLHRTNQNGMVAPPALEFAESCCFGRVDSWLSRLQLAGGSNRGLALRLGARREQSRRPFQRLSPRLNRHRPTTATLGRRPPPNGLENVRNLCRSGSMPSRPGLRSSRRAVGHSAAHIGRWQLGHTGRWPQP